MLGGHIQLLIIKLMARYYIILKLIVTFNHKLIVQYIFKLRVSVLRFSIFCRQFFSEMIDSDYKDSLAYNLFKLSTL